MLRTIKEILRPKQPTGNPYKLKDSEFAQLKELRSHPHFETYQEFLDKFCTLLSEDMLAASETQVVLYYRAYILGLRRAGTIVDEMINEEKAKDARSESRSRDRGSDTKYATFGYPYFQR